MTAKIRDQDEKVVSEQTEKKQGQTPKNVYTEQEIRKAVLIHFDCKTEKTFSITKCKHG